MTPYRAAEVRPRVVPLRAASGKLDTGQHHRTPAES